jgi:hypothetical protein
MSDSDDEQRRARRAKLRELKNPYAHHYFFGDEEEGATSPSTTSELRLSENPYATHYFEERASHSASSASTFVTTESQPQPTLSKAHFREGARAIFVRYIPAIEKGRLRKHHLDFINRNIDRSAEERASLLAELRRYDLVSEGPIQPHFNREEDVCTVEKLQSIEKAALKKAKG